MQAITVLDSILITFSVLFMGALFFIGNGLLWFVYLLFFGWLLS